MSCSARKIVNIGLSERIIFALLQNKNKSFTGTAQHRRCFHQFGRSFQDLEFSRSVTNRYFSDKPKDEKEEKQTEPSEGTENESPDSPGRENSESTVSSEELLVAQVKDLKDQLLRSLAEQDNTRRIAKRDVDSARSFAVTSFAKSLLDTSDNLTRAMEAVPPEYRNDTENHPVLATLYEGIKMTDDGLSKAFGKNGLKKFGAVGDKFDPNMHEALFEYPDDEKVEGTIGQVMKVGFSLNDRVIRPAEVGVVKKA